MSMTEAALHPYWNGMLCTETRDVIADRMRQVLEGHFFTMVICNSYSETSETSDRFTSVEVYPSQRLTGEIKAYRDSMIPGITWGTTSLSMGVHTKAHTPAEAREGRPHHYAHFTFEPGRFEIDHYAPAGSRLRWIFAIERHDREEF